MRKSVKHKRNQVEFEKVKQEIQGLKKRQRAGKVENILKNIGSEWIIDFS